jgi:hypothetical protein
MARAVAADDDVDAAVAIESTSTATATAVGSYRVYTIFWCTDGAAVAGDAPRLGKLAAMGYSTDLRQGDHVSTSKDVL